MCIQCCITVTWWSEPREIETIHHPSVLWHCWLGHQTCTNVVTKMTIKVLSGTVNLTQPTNQSAFLLLLTELVNTCKCLWWQSFLFVLVAVLIYHVSHVLSELQLRDSLCLVSTRECCRISPPHFLSECRKRRLNQASFVLLYFMLFAFLWVVFSFCFLVCLLFCIFELELMWMELC